MSKVSTFGEIMLRLSSVGYDRLFQNDGMQATFGGGEANVAVSLANFGIDSTYVTKLPEHAVGQAAVNALRYFGVDTEKIVRGGDRVGIYYLEKGISQRPSVCIYDRKYSAVAEASPSDFDWDNIFENADWFHITGITPALSDNLEQICLEAVKAAKKHGVTVSLDTNYRSKLWSIEKASRVIGELMRYTDICITNPGDIKDLFGIVSDKADFDLKKPDNEGAASVAEKLMKRYPLKGAALTLRTNLSASDNDFGAMLCGGEATVFSRKYRMHIADRVGGGDAFAAGLIYSLLKQKAPQDAVEFAAAAAVLKHSIEGDFNRVAAAEVENLAGGDGSGRVQR